MRRRRSSRKRKMDWVKLLQKTWIKLLSKLSLLKNSLSLVIHNQLIRALRIYPGNKNISNHKIHTYKTKKKPSKPSTKTKAKPPFTPTPLSKIISNFHNKPHTHNSNNSNLTTTSYINNNNNSNNMETIINTYYKERKQYKKDRKPSINQIPIQIISLIIIIIFRSSRIWQSLN